MTQAASDPTPTSQEHPEHLAHHFATPAQQFDAGKLGMWVFLLTEVLFFSGLFCAYAVYRHTHPAMFSIGAHFLNRTLGAANTAVLILSSFTMASAVYFAQRSNRRALIICLALTLVGGATFMTIKGFEYAHKITHGEVWGAGFDYRPDAENSEGGTAKAEHTAAAAPATASAKSSQPATKPAESQPGFVLEHTMLPIAIAAGPPGLAIGPQDTGEAAAKQPVNYSRKDLQIFMGIYFCLTGLHGIHVLAGMGVITWLLIGAIKGRFSAAYYTPVDLGGLYWHLVDLIWIYLFPLLYLID